MADISKCKGGKCSLKESCYRYKAKAGIYQSYMLYPKTKDDSVECDSYWEIEKNEYKRK